MLFHKRRLSLVPIWDEQGTITFISKGASVENDGGGMPCVVPDEGQREMLTALER